MPVLDSRQEEIARLPSDASIFLSGPASCGKTTTGLARLHHLLASGIPGQEIFLLMPQRMLQEPYSELLLNPERLAGGEVTISTIGGLARRTVDLFWPLISETAGFSHPENPPIFLTLETAQYYMARLVRPLLDEQGYFESVTIDRNRLYSQIIDNLNKAAVIGFPHTGIGARLDRAWIGEQSQHRVYSDVQECSSLFRKHCLEHNLLDFSLQLEVFWKYLWPDPLVRSHLVNTYRHLIYDNVEEDVPRAHDLIKEWLPLFGSSFLILDTEAGFRRFLGADIETALLLKESCKQHVALDRSFIQSPAVSSLSRRLSGAIRSGGTHSQPLKMEGDENPKAALEILHARFHPQILDKITLKVEELIGSGIPPQEIAILAPYIPDSLQFSITNRLQAAGIPWRTHRPSRSLRDEPACQAMMTLSAIAHPQWKIHPPPFDVAGALVHTLSGMDLVRANLLTGIVYHSRDLSLAPFDGIRIEVQKRITFQMGNRYTVLRDWLLAYRSSTPFPLDLFLRKLFEDVLATPGYKFHEDFDSVRVAASLVESTYQFRQALNELSDPDDGREYFMLLKDGLIAAQHLEGWRSSEKEAVLVAPAHTFLMMNRPVTVQVWLDPGSSGWYERLSQPLTHPYVLSRGWEQQGVDRSWSDADEVHASHESLAILVNGLLHRCRKGIILAMSELGEAGFEQRGELLRALQNALR
jgi:hypothetical protein